MSFAIADPSQLVSAPDDVALARRIITNACLQNQKQKDFSKQVVDFGAEHPDWLYRSCLAGHLTASALVVDPTGEKILLIHHKKIGLWLQPGGHADGDGNLAAVALKEISEETGLSELALFLPAFAIDIHTFPERGREPEHLHLDIRFVVQTKKKKLHPNHETNGAAWVSLDDRRLQEGNIQLQAAEAIKIVQNSRNI